MLEEFEVQIKTTIHSDIGQDVEFDLLLRFDMNLKELKWGATTWQAQSRIGLIKLSKKTQIDMAIKAIQSTQSNV